MLLVAVAEQKPLAMVSVTVLVPGVAYITPVGFCAVEVCGMAPFPKSQK
jgi:hypothetical protein